MQAFSHVLTHVKISFCCR